ncbi:VOC family protein [Sphingopyxis granuli]|uniref:VOC family protein n=1 Tax=Sphingopyxis granuli TaxID=267128 RepID=UPI001F538F96|nr:VOC family protein [Sphingopyxis granuli]UNK81069.1 VOC family protein [Sphingopyxis granuli]
MAIEEIRFRRLGYVALNVSDLPASREFYENIVGLKVDREPEGGELFLRCSDRHHDLLLHEGGSPGIKRIAWQMESEAALRALRSHFTASGFACSDVSDEECARLRIGAGAFRMSEPTTGACFEFYVTMAEAPSLFVPTHTKIARLGHVVVTTPDRPQMEDFLVNQMNFRVSDRIDGMVTFMRCFPNPYHHSFGVGAAPKAGLNHLNFMVTDLADIGKATNRFKQNGVEIVYGIGKHPPSESYFLYFLDPDGLTLEYSFGMEEFAEVAPRAPRDLPASLESVDYWGGIPDPRSGKGGEIERMI